jgi:membrane associated rhomboid family serine protease
MTPTPVGMRCPECSRQRTRVTTGPAVGSAGAFGRAPATFVLIAINVVAFLAEVAAGRGGFTTATGSVINDFALQGNAVAGGEWYRLVSGGFLHAGITHIAFNMFALYFLGRLLEPGIGTPRFVALYAASLLAGAFGALALTDPGQITVGASGAIFGIFGATFVIAGARGMRDVASQLGILLVLNLAITLSVPDISVGGHLGGLVGGVLCGLIVVAGERGKLGPRRLGVEIAAMAAIGILSVVGAVAVA